MNEWAKLKREKGDAPAELAWEMIYCFDDFYSKIEITSFPFRELFPSVLIARVNMTTEAMEVLIDLSERIIFSLVKFSFS